MAEAAVEFPSVPNYFCHRCARSVKINPTTVLTCPHCESEFIEELTQELEENDRARNNSRLTASPMDVATLLSNIFASVTPDDDYPFARSRNNNNTNNNRTAADDADDEDDKDEDEGEDEEEEQEEVEEMGERINRRLWVGPYRLPRPVRRRRNQESRPPPRFLGNMLLGRYPNFSDLFALSSQEFRSNPRDYAWGSDGLDNIITQLLNQMENSGPAPAKKEDIDNLPDVLVSATQIDLFAQCSVCMDYFIVEERVKELPCHHFYHEDCIVPWLKMHGTCPICRYSISPEESPMKTELNSSSHNNENNSSMDNTRNSPRPSRTRLSLSRHPPSSSSSSTSSSSWSPFLTALRPRSPTGHQHFSLTPAYSPQANINNNNSSSNNNNNISSSNHNSNSSSNSSSDNTVRRMVEEMFRDDNLHRIMPMELDTQRRNRFDGGDDDDDDYEFDTAYTSNIPNLDFIIEDNDEEQRDRATIDDDNSNENNSSNKSNLRHHHVSNDDADENNDVQRNRSSGSNNFRFFNPFSRNRRSSQRNNVTNNDNNTARNSSNSDSSNTINNVDNNIGKRNLSKNGKK